MVKINRHPMVKSKRKGKKSKVQQYAQPLNNYGDMGGQTHWSVTTRGPIMRSTESEGRTEVVLEKTEALITPVNTGVGGATNIQYYPFHPGNVNNPWLRNMSNAFSEYQILNLEYTYVPAVPTTTTGLVVVAFAPDYRDTVAVVAGDVQQYDRAVTAPIYAGSDGGMKVNSWGLNHPNTVGVPVPKYCYHNDKIPIMYRVSTNSGFDSQVPVDKNDLSCGQIVVATAGTTLNSASVGTVFVRYKIKLLGCVSINLNV